MQIHRNIARAASVGYATAAVLLFGAVAALGAGDRAAEVGLASTTAAFPWTDFAIPTPLGSEMMSISGSFSLSALGVLTLAADKTPAAAGADLAASYLGSAWYDASAAYDCVGRYGARFMIQYGPEGLAGPGWSACIKPDGTAKFEGSELPETTQAFFRAAAIDLAQKAKPAK